MYLYFSVTFTTCLLEKNNVFSSQCRECGISAVRFKFPIIPHVLLSCSFSSSAFSFSFSFSFQACQQPLLVSACRSSLKLQDFLRPQVCSHIQGGCVCVVSLPHHCQSRWQNSTFLPKFQTMAVYLFFFTIAIIACNHFSIFI